MSDSRKRGHPAKWANIGNGWRSSWRTVYWAIQWTSIGIMVRCIFRVIEFAQGYSGYLRTNEWAYYALDTLPLFLAILVWAFIWPPVILHEDGKYTSSPPPETYALGSGMNGSSPYSTQTSYDKV